MTPRRRLLTAASAALSLLALAGCEKPAPLVTVVNDGRSVYSEATTYCFPGQSLTANTCAQRATGVTRLAVVGGEPVGIDVAKPLLDNGWLIELSDAASPDGAPATPQQSPVQQDHYFTFTAPNLPPGSSLNLTVRSLDAAGQPNGVWAFQLVPR